MAGIARARLAGVMAVTMAGALGAALMTGSVAGAATGSAKARALGHASPSAGIGYRMVASDGGVFSFGGLQFLGSMGGKPLNQPVISMASPDPTGYWLVATDGGIFSFGDAPFLGSTGQLNPAKAPGGSNATTPSGPIVAIANDFAAPGYWEVSALGGVYSFGAAGFFGSMAGRPLNLPIDGIAPTADGGGYWLVAQDGSVYAFGDAVFPSNFAGPTEVGPMDQPVGPFAVAIASYASDNASFAVVTNDNRIYPYGAVTTSSGSPYIQVNTGGAQITAATTTAAGTAAPGIWTVSPVGGVYSFGSAGFFGSLPGQGVVPVAPIVGIDGY